MALRPIYSPEEEVARIERRALNRAIQAFVRALTNRIKDAVTNSSIPTWYDADSVAQLQTMHDNLCAKATKTPQNLLDIAGLSMLLLNFEDDV